MAPTRVILMSCGSFNPPTNMHLRMFEIARDHLHRMGTHIVVGGVISPVHDAYAKKELASATHRCSMLRLALQNNDWIRLSTWETRQNCWTKTRLCLQHHQNLLNSMLSNSNNIRHHIPIEDIEWIPENVKINSDNTPIQIKLLCGADLLESFGICGLWLEEDIDTIVGDHGLVVVTREGCNPNKFIYDSDVLSKHMHNIYIVTEWIPNEVSSTRIRRALKRSESVRYLLQDSVIDYIYKNEIYDVKVMNTTIKLELPSPNVNNYLHVKPCYFNAFLTPSPSDVTMGSPSPLEFISAASIDIPDAVRRKNLQNATSNAEAREQFVSTITVDNIKHVARVPAYPGQAKQVVVASKNGVARILDEVGGPLNESKAKLCQSDPSTRDEFVLKEGSKASTVENVTKVNIDVEQREVSDLNGKMEITDIDLGPCDNHEIIIKARSGQSSSNELRLKECCWPMRENTANDRFGDGQDVPQREMVSVDSSNSIYESRNVDKICLNQASEILSEKDSELVESIAKAKADIADREISSKGETVDASLLKLMEPNFVNTSNVVKVQPGHSNLGVVTMKDGHKLSSTEKVKIELDDAKTSSKEYLESNKINKDDRELSLGENIKHNIELDDIGSNSREKIANFEMDKGHLETKATTSSPDILMTPLDGRHECALSDFSVDKEDYRVRQCDSKEDEGEEEELSHCIKSGLMKYANEKEDTIDDTVDSANGSKINSKKNDTQVSISTMIRKGELEGSTMGGLDERTMPSEDLLIAKKLSSKVEEGGKFVENEEQTKEVFGILQEADKEPKEMEEELQLNIHSSERQTSCDLILEIDGKYRKSVVNSRKSPRKIKENQICDVEIMDNNRPAHQSEVFQTDMKTSEKAKKDQIRNIDADIGNEEQVTNDREISSTGKIFQNSSRTSSRKMKSPKKVKEFQIDENNPEFKAQDKSIDDRETSCAEKDFQNSSRRASTKTNSSRKTKESQIVKDNTEVKDQDKSISDREMSRSEKISQKSSTISPASTKSLKKIRERQVCYKNSEMKDYDRSVNDNVIFQLEEVFQDSSRKSSAKEDNLKKTSEDYVERKDQNRSIDNREASEGLSPYSSNMSSMKSSKKAQGQKYDAKANDKKITDDKKKQDFNEIKDVYTRKVRRYNMPLQGSLDSVIATEESSARKPKKDDAFSKKSKSYESIKRIQEVFLGVPNSGSQLDIPDDFCSICCYMNEITFRTEEEISSPNQEVFYTLRSACSSLADDDDSIECDICSSNLQESDNLDDKVLMDSAHEELPCEICRICGEVDGTLDQNSVIIPANRYAFKIIKPNQDDDDSFEIENCGFQSGTESADDRSRISEKEVIKEHSKPKSQSLFIHDSSINRDQQRELYFIPKDEIAILTSGTRRVGRKGSLFKKKEDLSVHNNRRYSSVDSLQLAKMSAKTDDKALKVAKNPTLVGSADNLRIARKSSRRSKSLQRSVDDVNRLDSSADNLDSVESLGTEKDAAQTSANSQLTPTIRDKEAVKMILTQHGIKIISEKETAL